MAAGLGAHGKGGGALALTERVRFQSDDKTEVISQEKRIE